MGNCLKLSKEQPSSVSGKEVEAENEDLRVFSYQELKKATNNFKLLDGQEGSSRTFYKGYVNETTFSPSRTGTGIAVSVMKCSSVAILELKEEVRSIGKISHPNLVKLLGYCCEENKSFLVFEYMHRGSLDRHIFRGGKVSLPWEIRIKIAIEIAQGFAFLHSIRKKSLLYREIRMYNIFLDEQYNGKLFYLESYEDHLDDATLVGTEFQYVAPECVMGIRGSRMETNVYTFGVILLELLTGTKVGPNDHNKQSLGVWYRVFLPDNYKIKEIVDPRLGNSYPVNAAAQMITLIRGCTKTSMKERPLMQEVMDVLNHISEIKY